MCIRDSLRAYGYTFYSDWLQNNPVAGATGDGVPSLPASPQYQLLSLIHI